MTPILNVNAEDTVTISGNVSFSDYKSEKISVMARKQKGASPDFIATIPKPGKYNLKVLKNTGLVYISAANLQADEVGLTGNTPSGNFEQNPIDITDKDINGIDITLHNIRSAAPKLMDTYTGQTVTVAGEVVFKDYKEGSIIIFAKEEGGVEGTRIADVKISKPGKYAMKVPKNFGKIEVGALNIKRREKSPPAITSRGEYKKNPIKVESSNINNIDIEIKK